MHRVVAGCNLWAILFLIVAFAMGAMRARYHVAVGIFAAVFALLAQCAIFALFMGASKLLKEHVALYRLEDDLIARTNRIMLPLFGWASITSSLLVLFAIIAGLGASGEVPLLAHAVLGVACLVLLVIAVAQEVPALAEMHQVLLDMEARLPEQRPAPSAGEGAADEAEQAAILRRRALFYVGSTVLAMLLGYRFIAGIRLPLALTIVVGGLAGLCLLGWALLSLRPAGAAKGRA